MSDMAIRGTVDKDGTLNILSVDLVEQSAAVLRDPFQGGESPFAGEGNIAFPKLKTVYPHSLIPEVMRNMENVRAKIAIQVADDTHEDISIRKPGKVVVVGQRAQVKAREAVDKMFEVGKPEDFNGSLASIFSPYKLRLLNNSQAVTGEDVIEAIQGNLNEAQFDYVINAVGELLGLQAKELILKLCK